MLLATSAIGMTDLLEALRMMRVGGLSGERGGKGGRSLEDGWLSYTAVVSNLEGGLSKFGTLRERGLDFAVGVAIYIIWCSGLRLTGERDGLSDRVLFLHV